MRLCRRQERSAPHVIHAIGLFRQNQAVRIKAVRGVDLRAASAIVELEELMDGAVRGLPDRVLAGGRRIGEQHSYNRILRNVGREFWKWRLLLLCAEVADQKKEDDQELGESSHVATSKNFIANGLYVNFSYIARASWEQNIGLRFAPICMPFPVCLIHGDSIGSSNPISAPSENPTITIILG